MTFSVRTIDLASNSKDFIPLSAREYKSDYTPLPNANLPQSLRFDLNVFFQLLTGEELSLEENTFLIKSYEGVYSRLFGPVLKVGQEGVGNTENDKLYIQWGPRFIPLTSSPGQMLTQNNTELDVEFSTYNFSGRGDDPALLLSVDTEEGQLVMPIVVRFADWENPIEPKVLNTMLKKTPEKLVEVIQKVSSKTGNGGSRERIEADAEVDFKELEVNKPYEVIGYYPCKTSYGTSYRIFVNNVPEESQTSVCWAHSSIRPLLATRPEITRDKPATLMLRFKEEMDNGRTKIRSSLILSRQEDDPESLNLDF